MAADSKQRQNIKFTSFKKVKKPTIYFDPPENPRFGFSDPERSVLCNLCCPVTHGVFPNKYFCTLYLTELLFSSWLEYAYFLF